MPRTASNAMRSWNGAECEVGVRRVELEVLASNTRAVHVFEQSGFVREGVKCRARVLDGREDDVVCMALFV
jgi:RimJ/RimL family protein N-acetyltransferase